MSCLCGHGECCELCSPHWQAPQADHKLKAEHEALAVLCATQKQALDNFAEEQRDENRKRLRALREAEVVRMRLSADIASCAAPYDQKAYMEQLVSHLWTVVSAALGST